MQADNAPPKTYALHVQPDVAHMHELAHHVKQSYKIVEQ
jgi:hypothetical protein